MNGRQGLMGGLAAWIWCVPGFTCTTDTLDWHQEGSVTVLRILTVNIYCITHLFLLFVAFLIYFLLFCLSDETFSRSYAEWLCYWTITVCANDKVSPLHPDFDVTYIIITMITNAMIPTRRYSQTISWIVEISAR